MGLIRFVELATHSTGKSSTDVACNDFGTRRVTHLRYVISVAARLQHSLDLLSKWAS